MSKFICNNPTDGGMCHLDAEHYGPCIPSQPASASSTPEPKQFLQDAAGLCQSEANKWEHHDLKTFQHWEKVAMLLRAEFLVQSAKPVAPQPAPSSPEEEFSPAVNKAMQRFRDKAKELGLFAPSSPSPQRAKCDGCGADYDPKFAETTCIVCDGIIQPTVAQPTPVESQSAERIEGEAQPTEPKVPMPSRDPLPKFESGRYSSITSWHSALATWAIRQLDVVQGKTSFLSSVFDCVRYQAGKEKFPIGRISQSGKALEDPMRFSQPSGLEMQLVQKWLEAYAQRLDLHHHTFDELMSMQFTVAAYTTWRMNAAVKKAVENPVEPTPVESQPAEIPDVCFHCEKECPNPCHCRYHEEPPAKRRMIDKRGTVHDEGYNCALYCTPVESTGLEEQAREMLSRRGLADLSVHWPTGKPLPKIDYESGEAKPNLTELMAEFAAHISQEKDARITQLEKGAEGLERRLTWALQQLREPHRIPGQNDEYCNSFAEARAALLEYQKIKQA